MTEQCADQHVQLLLGAYLLGGLSAQDERCVREHLAQCQDCRDDHDELACVPTWLRMLSRDDLDPPPSLGETEPAGPPPS